MATRTTAEKVLEIIKTKLTEDEVEPYVTSANVMVTQALGSSGLGVDVLAEIERWVAAHMIAVTKTRQATNEKAGTASVTYGGKYGANLSSTSYGQMALTLDTTGALVALGGRAMEIYAVPSFD
jgi:hypothetical protein